MKTYVLIVSRQFPAIHPRKGEPTGFPDMILNREKLHTIRANYELWKKRIDEVNEGKAIISLRYWTGKPYHKNSDGIAQYEFFQLNERSGIGYQKIDMVNLNSLAMIYKDSGVGAYQLAAISKNDGLNLQDFKYWFKGYDLSKPMAIIHFTKFRY